MTAFGTSFHPTDSRGRLYDIISGVHLIITIAADIVGIGTRYFLFCSAAPVAVAGFARTNNINDACEEKEKAITFRRLVDDVSSSPGGLQLRCRIDSHPTLRRIRRLRLPTRSTSRREGGTGRNKTLSLPLSRPSDTNITIFTDGQTGERTNELTSERANERTGRRTYGHIIKHLLPTGGHNVNTVG